VSEEQGYRPAPGAPAAWYPLPGGGQRYWDGLTWVGDPVPSTRRPQHPSDPMLVTLAIAGSLVLSPLVGIVMGVVRMRKNRSEAWKMIIWGIAVWVVAVVVIVAFKSS
jgi:hypothetical protein